MKEGESRMRKGEGGARAATGWSGDGEDREGNKRGLIF
jgi:hypothetical protein